jgi:thiol-disulfide isomerase/thioredoxin
VNPQTCTRRACLRGISSAVAAATAAALTWPDAAQAAPARPGERVRWPTVTLLDGSRFGPEEARDHAVIVVFWSLTCPFCLRHNRHVTRLHQAIGSRPLRIVTAVREPDERGVREHLARQGHHFPVTLQAAALAEVLATRRISPLTVTVGRDGRLRQVIPGEMAEDDVMELLQLANPGPAS